MSPRPRACGRQGAGPGGGGSIPHERNHGAGDHPIPSRTRQLSPASPKVLRRQVAGGQGVPLMGDGSGPAAGPFQVMAPSSSGLGRRPLKAEVAGSNPVGATKFSRLRFFSAFFVFRLFPMLHMGARLAYGAIVSLGVVGGCRIAGRSLWCGKSRYSSISAFRDRGQSVASDPPV